MFFRLFSRLVMAGMLLIFLTLSERVTGFTQQQQQQRPALLSSSSSSSLSFVTGNHMFSSRSSPPAATTTTTSCRTLLLHMSTTTSGSSSSSDGPAVLDRPETIEKKAADVDQDKKTERQNKVGGEGWEIRLFNDPVNKREFVAMCLSTICGKTDTESYQIMMAAHKNGMGVVGRYQFEIAELYYGSLKKEGLMVDMVQVDDE